MTHTSGTEKTISLDCLSWNVRSLNNKVEPVMDYIISIDSPIVFIQETWLTDSKNHTTAIIKNHGYKIHHTHRPNSNGGGVAILFKSNIKVIKLFIGNQPTFESVTVKIVLPGKNNLICACIYRTGTMSSFLSDFDTFVGTLFSKSDKVLICGDFNIHMDELSKHQTEFNKVISSYGLYQLTKAATHKSGHILDLVIATHNIVSKKNVSVLPLSEDFPTCDHSRLLFTLNLKGIPSNNIKHISFRNLKNIEASDFRANIQESLSILNDDNKPFSEVIQTYNENVSDILQKHAPELSKVIKDVPDSKWFDSEYKAARSRRRKAEKIWKKTQSEDDRYYFEALRDFCNKLADSKKKEYFKKHFEKYNHSQKGLYKFVDTFLDHEKSLVLPSKECLQNTVNEFNLFFSEKVEKIRKSFMPNGNELQAESIPDSAAEKLYEFQLTSEDEIKAILSETDIKSCDLDPIPACLMNDNIDIFIPTLCNLVNASLTSSSMDGLKSAYLMPLLKGSSLDANNLKNYRPVSNLAFVGKIIEKVVQRRLNDHLTKNNLNIDYQSAYKKKFSTETLLIRIVNDLLIAADENKATVVMLLDLSAAFDTVDHQKLLNILEREIGISGLALKWFKSYLSGRCQRVRINGTESVEIIIKFGVPQGSVLGPILFNIYIRSIYKTVKSRLFNIHGFADDHQIFKTFRTENEYQIMTSDLPRCFKTINTWMSSHYLQLNPGKTEVIVFGKQNILSKLELKGLFITPDICVRLVSTTKNLGFYLDSGLTFTSQIDKVKLQCFRKLRNIAKMKPFLSLQHMQQLIQSLVISSIDYCNSLYYGTHSKNIRVLQTIQNRACATVLGLKKRDPKTEHLKGLHWLKIPERIEFKILLIVFKSLNGLAPEYLSSLVTYNNISGSRVPTLRTYIPKSKLGCRAFIFIAAKLWNNLPTDIRSCYDIKTFKIKLKTFLFQQSYKV